jgi:pimeloyl-ACP methyl ester carboxylesterase
MGSIGLILAAPVALAIAVAVLWQRSAARRDAREHPPPGRMIEISPRCRLHSQLAGDGPPAVVFEAGIAATALSWRFVQDEVSKFAQTISYDRAGLGWSDPISGGCDLDRILSDLRTLLDRTAIAAPRIVVGHSFGGLIALAYAARYPEEIGGLVLVDPAGASEWADPTAANRAMLGRGIFLARVGGTLAHLGVVRGALNLAVRGSAAIPRLVARASSGRGGAAFTERMIGEVRKLPRDAWRGVQLHWSDPKCFAASAHHLRSLPEIARTVLRDSENIDAPVIVLSAGNASPAQRADHERLVRTARRARLEIVQDSGHWIVFDRPDVIVKAIAELRAANHQTRDASLKS